ncbi:gibberellin 2-beta-dioxygenase 2-like isoform X2 [Corylus avellana]|uniref:gibberellin 2-beta-dioxygenase 2-like isoform X2 n=1 Tax=Corylus avellana TaxID=13451 RepID=UPI00286AD6C1|nr:gibberellin 2-beta-dioxygenase 2-like isoform X2 [Corylus avellana]
MVVVVPSPTAVGNEKLRAMELPVVDLSAERSEVSKVIVKACEEYGFFKVVNHGVPQDVILKLEEQALRFFSLPLSEKQRAGPADPLGYGCKNIGFNGDTGEVEYLTLNTNPLSIAQRSTTISNNPSKFSSAVNGYVEAVRELACELLDLTAEGLLVSDRSLFTRLIRDVDSDSILRLNHYPPIQVDSNDRDSSPSSYANSKVGFGAHSDPQILTLLRSNDVGGLQISIEDGVWIPVPPDPTAFWVNAMTNGRLVSVRHRALTYSRKSRMSMAFFGAPPLQARIAAPPEMVAPNRLSLYRPFTWAEYKKTAYSLRLEDTRLDLFMACKEEY